MIDIELLTVEELEHLRDACNRRLLQMRNTARLNLTELLRLLEEVKITLSDQGKHWHSLECWQWKDGQICFWLNPTDQVRYRSGWYSIDELIAWTHNYGPIMADLDVDDVAECDDNDTASTVEGVAISWLKNMTESDLEADTERFELV